jgi:hypothetical protein
VADNEVKVIVTAEDRASETLRGVKESLTGIGDELEVQGTDAGAWGDSLATAASAAGEAVESKANFPVRALSQLLSGVGLSGPAQLLRVGAAASTVAGPMWSAAFGTEGLAVAVGTLDIALGPVLLVLAAIVMMLAPLIEFVVAFKIFGAVIKEAFTGTSQWSQALRNLFKPISDIINKVKEMGAAIKQHMGAGVAEFLVKTIAGAQAIAVGALNKGGKAVFDFVNRIITRLNVIVAAAQALGIGISLINPLTWKDIPLDLSWTQGLNRISKADAIGAAGSGGMGGFEENPFTEMMTGGGTGGGGGGGGGSIPTGGTGGAGVGAGRRLTNAPSAFTDSAGVDRLQLQVLERVDGRMQELIDLLSRLPEITRDAIVVYQGAQ